MIKNFFESNLKYGYPYSYKEVIRLSDSDFIKAGILVNPWKVKASFSFSLEILFHKTLYKELEKIIRKKDRSYLFILGHSKSGSGKSHSLKIVKNFCKENQFPFIYVNEITKDMIGTERFQKTCSKIARLLKDFKEVYNNSIFIPDEIEEAPGLYKYAIKLGYSIIGAGHQINDLGDENSRFKIVDIDLEHFKTDLTKNLSLIYQNFLKETGIHERAFSKNFIQFLSKKTKVPGEGITAICFLTSFYTLNFKNNKERKTNLEDVDKWLSKQFKFIFWRWRYEPWRKGSSYIPLKRSLNVQFFSPKDQKPNYKKRIDICKL